MTEAALAERAHRFDRWVQRALLISLIGLALAVLVIGIALYGPSEVAALDSWTTSTALQSNRSDK